MNKILLISLLFTVCNPGNSLDDNWRKYFASEKSLQKGYVKTTIIDSNLGTFIYYDKVFKEQGKIFLHRYDGDFEIVREDINTFDSEKMVLAEATYYYDGIGAVPARIIEPTIAPYKPTKEILKSHLQFQPAESITISIVSEAKFQRFESYTFNNEDIKCLRFSYDEEYSLTNKDNPLQSFNHTTSGYTLWAENLGLIYMRFEGQRGITEFRIEKILSIEEFEKLKH